MSSVSIITEPDPTPDGETPNNNHKVVFEFSVKFEALSDNLYDDGTPPVFDADILAEYLLQCAYQYGSGSGNPTAKDIYFLLLDWNYGHEPGQLKITVKDKE